MDHWKPNLTVAAVVERAGRLLMVEEHTREGVRLNQPAGHLEPGESLAQAAVREALEETAYQVEPIAFLGVYMATSRASSSGDQVTYLRHAFVCRVLSHDPERRLDDGIIRALWMTPAEITEAVGRHRSPLVAGVVADFMAGRRYPLDLVRTDPSALRGTH